MTKNKKIINSELKKPISIDIVQNKRIKLKPWFISHVLSEEEILVLDTIKDKKSKIEFIAGRWAAKEAIFKLGYAIPFNQIAIDSSEGPCYILNAELEGVSISISHERKYSVASAFKNY